MSRRASGSVLFAAIIILTAGALDLVWGISALSNREYFAEDELLVSGLTTWGWIYVVVGVAQLAVGWLVLTERPWGFGLGMFGAFLAILVHFLAVGAYPVWSVLLIALNFAILFILATNLED